jgi:hypothetical protein
MHALRAAILHLALLRSEPYIFICLRPHFAGTKVSTYLKSATGAGYVGLWEEMRSV